MGTERERERERENQCLENYLRCMTFAQPTKWHHWLAHAEWWYNTSLHTSLKMTPFQALYARPPPLIAKNMLPMPDLEGNGETSTVEEIANHIQQNMLKA
jgi:hypothetical protein